MKEVSSLPLALGHGEGHSLVCSSSPQGPGLLIPEEPQAKAQVPVVSGCNERGKRTPSIHDYTGEMRQTDSLISQIIVLYV